MKLKINEEPFQMGKKTTLKNLNLEKRVKISWGIQNFGNSLCKFNKCSAYLPIIVGT